MNPELSLCSHLSSLEISALPIESDDIVDWYDGPVLAVVRCPSCASTALIKMLDWSCTHSVRVYGVAALDPDAFQLFSRNTKRGSCDITRFNQETHALVASCGAAERLVALHVYDKDVRAVAAYPQSGGLPTEPWGEQLPDEDDDTWFRHVGLSKSAA